MNRNDDFKYTSINMMNSVGKMCIRDRDKRLLKKIINILNNNSMELSLQKLDCIAQNTRKTINIFIATPHIAYVVDLVDGKSHIKTLDNGIHLYSSCLLYTS